MKPLKPGFDNCAARPSHVSLGFRIKTTAQVHNYLDTEKSHGSEEKLTAKILHASFPKHPLISLK